VAADEIATLAELRAIVTDAVSVSDVLCQEALDFAAEYLNEQCTGLKLNRLSIYLAGHWLGVAGLVGGGGGGTPASITIGSISKSYATVPPSDPSFGSTSWGRLFSLLVEQMICFVGVTGGDYPSGGGVCGC
jgi:hypothetical protein